MIVEDNVLGWNNIPVKSDEVIYPQAKDNNAPKNYFLGIFCGCRGSGKSYLFTKLLKTLEEKKAYLDDKLIPQRIILISSTAHSDSNKIFKTLKHLDWDNDVIEDYDDDLLKIKMDELKAELTHSKDYKLYKEAWKKFIECKKIEDLNDDELKLLYSYDFIPFKEFPKPKYPDGFLIHWIIDDMLGTNIFKNGRSAFTNLCIRNRHIIPGNIIIAIQSIMSVPKTIRLNANLLALFKFADSDTVLEDVYPLFSAFVKEDKFKELYEYATQDQHNALVIDATRGKPIFKKNFDKVLNIS
jgi:hypothetical protein